MNGLIVAIKKDKYFLPTLNWALFTAICAVIVLYFLGELFGIVITIISALVFGPLQKFSPNTIKHLSDSFSGLQTNTHLIIFIVQLTILSSILCIDKIREKLWKIIQNLTLEK